MFENRTSQIGGEAPKVDDEEIVLPVMSSSASAATPQKNANASHVRSWIALEEKKKKKSI